MLRRSATAVPSLCHRLTGRERASFLQLQLRPFSDGTSSTSEAPPPPPQAGTFTYEAPFSTAVRRVKKLSLFSCLCAVGAGPIILGLDPSTSATAKVSIAGTLGSFGVFTTGLLHWFTSPYVHRLVYDPSTDSADVTTLDLLARPRRQHINVAEAREAETMHPLSSFSAGGKIYYVDADHFANKELLKRLVPQPETPEEGSEADGGDQHPAGSSGS